MSRSERFCGLELLQASGVLLPAMKERPEEGTSATPPSQLRASYALAGAGSPSSADLSKRVSNLPNNLRLLSRVFGGWVCG